MATAEPGLRNPAYGRWPWKPETHSDLLQELGQVKPGVVAWDILFTEYNEAEADALAQGVIKSDIPIVFGTKGGERDEGVLPGDEQAKASRLAPLLRIVGDRSLIDDSDSIILPSGQLSRLA